MKALVKKAPGKGLEMQQVPMPVVGGNDLLVKVTKAAICGTDLHIWNWDEWSQRTLRPPLITGHEFVGTDRRQGRQRDRLRGRGAGLRGRAHRLRRLPELPGGTPAPLHEHGRHRREPRRLLRRIPLPARFQRLARASGDPLRDRLLPRPAGKRHAFGPLLRPGGRGRADHRRGAHRHHGRRPSAGTAAPSGSWSRT